MEGFIKFIDLKTTFQAPFEVFDGSWLKGLPLVNELLQTELSLGPGWGLKDVMGIDTNFSLPLGLGFGLRQGLSGIWVRFG